MGLGRPDGVPLVTPEAVESPSRKLTLLGSVLFCGSACAPRTGPAGVAAPTRLRSGSPARTNDESEDWFDASSVNQGPAVLTLGASAAEVNADVLCPTFEGHLQVYEEYEFIAAVGVGAFGRVLKVHHRASGRNRACKCLSAATQLERGLADTEVEVLKSLNHPNIVRLHEVFVEPGNEQNRKVYLITELFEGGDLLFRITHHYQTLQVPMKEGHISYMMRQILSAIAYCHHRNVVHRDVKPDNILFVDAGAASPLKIIDFGLAGFAERLREAAREVSVPRSSSLARLARLLPAAGARWCHVRKQMMQRAGTAFYMAPEMISVGRYDTKADMFSIGAILSELLTGWHPFYNPNVDDTASVHAKITAPGAVRLPRQTFASCSREAIDLCQRLLEKDPRRRLSASQALAHAFFRDPSKPTPYGSMDTGALTARTFAALRQFRASHKVRRAALVLLAHEASEPQVHAIRDAFHALDSQGDGMLSPEELRLGAARVEVRLADGEAEALIAVMGGARGSRAGYKEFLASQLEQHVPIDDSQLRRVFRKFDAGNKGYIALEDMERVLVTKGTDTRPLLSHGEWLEICAPCSGTDSASEAVLKFSRFSEVVLAPEASLEAMATRGALLADADEDEEDSSGMTSDAGDMQASDTLSTAAGICEVPIATCSLCTLSPNPA